MNKIITRLNKIKEEKRLGIMAHIVLGYPSLQDSIGLVHAMAGAGVDFIELQIPFSDPLADGPTIMKANEVSLKRGFKVKDAFAAAQNLVGAHCKIPLLFMTYFNLVFHYGVEQFCRDAAEVGVSGLIVPDIPIDEEAHDHFLEHAARSGLVAMRFLSTVSTDERVEKVLDKPNQFLYFIGQKGTTGARASLHKELAHHLQRIRAHKDVSIAVGFGVSTHEHIKTLKEAGADVAIVGSAVLDVFNKVPQGQGIDAVKKYLRTLVDAGEGIN
ncbi:MAG: tryptophan synthase subunit alpha [Patescibacteria group bacterium]